jgi:hypothetical protein
MSAPAVFAGPVINEVMSSNSSTIQDEDGDYSDWIEIYNPDATDVNLAGYGLSDDPAEPFKWVFPDYTLGSRKTMLVFASDKDRSVVPNHWETVVTMGDELKYAIGSYSTAENWRTRAFDDAEWDAGPSGIGSIDDGDDTIIEQVRSVFVRTTFTVADVANIMNALLHIDYEDGFVAYINGVEIARANMDSEPGTIPDATKLSSGERKMLMYEGGDPESHSIANFADVIQNGENVLAIEVHNNAGYFSDISVIPFLTFGMKAAPAKASGISERLVSAIKAVPFHTNFKIKSAGETLMLTSGPGVVADSLDTGEIGEDRTIGRKPSGSVGLVFFDVPTPGERNTAPAIFGEAETVEVLPLGGIFDNTVSIGLTVTSEIASIRYTLDGSDPAETSALYTEAVVIDSTTVLKARAFERGKFDGPINTNTYLINEDIELPIISISINPENLWDPDTGIYVKGNSDARGGYDMNQSKDTGNYYEDWEKPIHIEMYEPNGTQGFSIDAGMKISGKNSRKHPQKSLAIFVRPEYGTAEIDYKIFPDQPITKFSKFLLRATGNNQITEKATLIRDGLCQTIMGQLDLETLAYRPAVVFINGVYWGIQNIREKPNEDYIASHQGVDPERVDILDDYHAVFVNANVINEYKPGDKTWTCLVVEGNADHYNALLRYMLDHDESDPEVYEYLKTQIDIENFIDYMAAQIYISNPDGPGHNTKMWRPQTENGRWRWLVYDVERGFGVQVNPFGIPGPAHVADLTDYYIRYKQTAEGRSPDANFLMYSLLTNDEFKAQFVNRYADHLNTIFSTDQVMPVIERLAAAIESEIPRHLARHDFAVKSMDTWHANVDYIKNFADLRPQYTRENIVRNLGLGGTADVTLNVSDPLTGSIQISSLAITEFPWTGTYFKDVPVKLTAIPAPGYRFAGWVGINTVSPSISVTLTEAATYTATFVADNSAQNTIIINEINYNSSVLFDAEDWIELYNAYDIPVDLSGWTLQDISDSNIFSIPGGIVIPAGGYCVLVRDAAKFSAVFPGVKNAAGDFGFGLSNAGDTVRLFNTNGELIDSVTYGDASPWPADADGIGSTLSLISPDLDNAVAENWSASAPKGTPGIANDQVLSVDDDQMTDAPTAFALGQNFPNPFNPVTTIPFSLAESGRVTVEVYSILGRLVDTVVDEHMSPGTYNVTFNTNGLSAGIYIYTIKTGAFSESKQMLLLK